MANQCKCLYNTKEEFISAKPRIYERLACALYGEIPPKPDHLTVDNCDVRVGYLGGKATLTRHTLKVEYGRDHFSFSATSVVPNGSGRYPTFLHISAGEDDGIIPIEEIIDNGCAIIFARAEEIAEDNDDMRSGCAKWLTRGRWRCSRPGKIAIWAWSLLRMLEYALTTDCVEKDRIAVIGQGHLGAAALYAGGYDERIKYIISNGGGVGIDAVTDDDDSRIYRRVSEAPWRYTKPARDMMDKYPDATQLLSLCVPRHIMVGGAIEDIMCDVAGQAKAIEGLAGLYELFGNEGIPAIDAFNEPNIFQSRSVSYHARRSSAFLSREDWNVYINYIKM